MIGKVILGRLGNEESDLFPYTVDFALLGHILIAAFAPLKQLDEGNKHLV